MGDACDILFNDGALIKITGDKVSSRPDQLDASRVGLVIRLSPLKLGRNE